MYVAIQTFAPGGGIYDAASTNSMLNNRALHQMAAHYGAFSNNSFKTNIISPNASVVFEKDYENGATDVEDWIQ